MLAPFYSPSLSLSPEPVGELPLWKHQIDGYRHLCNHTGALLAHDMGTGKSRTVITYLNDHPVQRVLILCPLSVIPAWQKQFELHATKEYNVVALQQRWTSDKKEQVCRHELSRAAAWHLPMVVLVNYESAWRSILANWLLQQDWDLVVADESHRIKDSRGRASVFVGKLGRKAKRRIALTGTPMPHSPLDIYAQYRFLDPTIFGPSYYAFHNRYSVLGGYGNKEVVAYKNEEELQRKFYSIAHRVLKEDVLDLPTASHVERVAVLEGGARTHYLNLSRHFITEVQDGTVTASNALVKLLRLQQLTSGFLKDEDGNERDIWDGKEALLRDTLEDLAVREPVVVFCRFQHDLRVVRRLAASVGRSYGELSGSGNDLARWQGGGCYILGVQWQSGGVGVDLSLARYGVLYSTGFSLGDYEQGLARLHRPGQRYPVTFIHLIVEGTVDRKVYSALREKRDVVTAILDGIKKGETI